MRSRKPLWIAVIAIGTVLVLGLGATTLVLYFTARDAARPEALVSRYLSHVQHGQIEAAMKLEGRKADPAQVLLTDAAYAKVSQQLSSFRIERVRPVASDRVRVDAQTVAGGAKEAVSFTLTHGDDGPVGWLGVHAWKLQPVALSTVTVAVGTHDAVDVTIAGAKLHWDGKVRQLLAFPGRYALAAPAAGAWYSIAGADATVTGFGQGVNLRASSTLTPAGVDAATAATNAWVNACLAGGPQPKGCSFGLDSGQPDGETWTNVRWEMTAAPAVTFSAWDFDCAQGTILTAGCWPVTTSTKGSADFHADYRVAASGETGEIYSTTPGDIDVQGSILSIGPAGAEFQSITWG
ncbi:hypothetical protein LLS1_00770 [Leifsonia sp. LS1]|uniref:hypothetical protein n=1 Tax=unclassified Leifsonia TaxID=2663824 RepID=UPI001CBEE896|nr:MULTISPECIES: hypothetical protein [unclassified Leifsonia]UAJ79576.1 hypothetical protein IT072_00215 [Leifsonia sp. ZF2019]GIT78408.1 hypothetical protein LLS1_00770 [Leifsonia sp. LS1]